VPRFGDVDLIDIDVLDPQVIRKPKDARLRAWTKLLETERRWVMFEWLAHSVRVTNRCRLLFDDFASAYLLSFEATVQLLKSEYAPGGSFEKWLGREAAYDLTVRGLRTLRHLEAHVRPGSLNHDYQRSATSLFFGGSDAGKTVAWLFPTIEPSEFASLRDPKLAGGELDAWNSTVQEVLAAELMRRGLRRLQELLLVVEAVTP